MRENASCFEGQFSSRRDSCNGAGAKLAASHLEVAVLGSDSDVCLDGADDRRDVKSDGSNHHLTVGAVHTVERGDEGSSAGLVEVLKAGRELGQGRSQAGNVSSRTRARQECASETRKTILCTPNHTLTTKKTKLPSVERAICNRKGRETRD